MVHKSQGLTLRRILQRPVETKEVHCTATYGRKSVNFQWTVTREMVTLEGFKKKLCEYLTFPDGTENEHIVIIDATQIPN